MVHVKVLCIRGFPSALNSHPLFTHPFLQISLKCAKRSTSTHAACTHTLISLVHLPTSRTSNLATKQAAHHLDISLCPFLPLHASWSHTSLITSLSWVKWLAVSLCCFSMMRGGIIVCNIFLDLMTIAHWWGQWPARIDALFSCHYCDISWTDIFAV